MSDFYVPEAELQDRAKFLEEVASDLVNSGTLPEDRVVLRLGRVPILTAAYFLLNEAYKAWRIVDCHNTERPKIAALMCLATMTFPLFRPIMPSDAQSIAEARANEILALDCACAILGIIFDLNDPHQRDFWLRFLDVLSDCRSETLEPYVVDQNLEINRPLNTYQLAVHDADKPIINCLVSMFEVLSGKITVQKSGL